MKRVVYFIKPVGQPGPIKIGVTVNVKNRFAAFQFGSPLELEIAAVVPGNVALETRIHNHFAYARARDEWFHPVPALVEGIARLQAGEKPEDVFDLYVVTGYLRRNNPKRKAAWTATKRERCGYRARLRNLRWKTGCRSGDRVDAILPIERDHLPLTDAERLRLDAAIVELTKKITPAHALPIAVSARQLPASHPPAGFLTAAGQASWGEPARPTRRKA